MTNPTTISGADERIRPVEDPSGRWSDAVSFSAWDDDSGLFLLVRMAVLPNQPGATAGVLAWVGARPVYAYGHALDEVPLADWDDLAVAGLRVQELEALRAWEVNLVDGDGDNGFSLQWTGFSTPVGYEHLPRAVAHGHYEQSCRVTGQVDLNGHRLRVDGVGQRGHTWGVRQPEAVRGWRTLSGFLGPSTRAKGTPCTDRTFQLWEVTAGDGAVGVHGYVHDGGEDLRIEAAEIADGDQTLDVVLTVEGGRRFTLGGTAHGGDVPVRPAGVVDDAPTLLHQRLVRWESDDGLDGYGIAELLDHGAASGDGAPGTP